MQTLKHCSILAIILGLILIGSPVYAIYSPTISNNVSQIRDHIVASQKQNGVGSLMEISSSIVSQTEAKRKAGEPTGIPGLAQKAREQIIKDAVTQSTRPLGLYDSILMSFNILPSKGGGIISNCLRNDIWTLESLKDIVGEEMVKAYMLGDIFHGDQLSRDYQYLVEEIDLLRRHGNDKDYTFTQVYEKDGKQVLDKITMQDYLFGEDGGVYYYSFAFPSDQGCPEGDFEKAFIKVANSAKTLATLSTAQGTADWGNIWEMAKVRAKQRAAQWFSANQIALTLGGGQGGRSLSLIKNNGWDQRMAEMETQIRILKNLGGFITAPFNLDIYQHINGVDYVGGDSACAAYDPETGKYYPCTPQQVKNFNTCQLTIESAKKEGLIQPETDSDLSLEQKRTREKKKLDELKSGLNCRILKSTRSSGSLTQTWKKALEEKEQGQVELENEINAFYKYVEFADVGESSLDELSDALVGLENEIKRGLETSGTPEEEDKGLPSFQENLTTMINRHCPNKKKDI